MKSVLSQVIFCVLLLISISTTEPAEEKVFPVGRAGNHNLILCDNVDESSRLAYSVLFTREAKFLQTRTETLYWPMNELNFAPITCIRVFDQIPNNLGGYVDITRGGIDKTYVEFVFTSQWSRRMSFKVEIYTQQPPIKI